MAITSDQYPLLIAAPMLQDYLVDKDLGTPLAAGIVTFYQDNARTVLKNVYYQTGVPGAYSYIPLPNPNVLTSVGTIADNGGNDVIPFFFPYNELNDAELQPYYVTVFSSNPDGTPAVEQFTRENFPFVTQQETPDTNQQDLINLISDGQFPAHNNLPNAGLYPNGASFVTVAPGGSLGWQFQKPPGSTDTDFLTFVYEAHPPAGLDGNPRWALNFTCTSTAASDTFKELVYQFNNVNRFASATQLYTYSFSGISNTGSPITLSLKLIKNFGTGGSTTTTTTLTQFTLAPGAWKQFSFSFVFGDNSSQTIGTLNDDYLQLALVFPSEVTTNLSVTDFVLTPGEITLITYPERPDNLVFADAISGSLPTPNFDGSSYYLPIVATPAGATYDTSVVGRVEAYISSNPGGNLLLMNGQSFLHTDYSALGVPYSRLQSYLIAASPLGENLGIGGTGANYATCYGISTVAAMIVTTNKVGSQTAATDGAIPTNFTFSTSHTGQTTGVKAYCNGGNNILVQCNAVGSVTAAVDFNTGFTIAQLVDNTLSYSAFTISTVAASAITAGHYFTFSTPSTNYYVWYSINGVGVDPAPGGTGIKVDLKSTNNATEVGSLTLLALNGYQVSYIVSAAASTLTAGSYFTFAANSVTYAVWYKIAGAGTAPVGAFTTLMVSLAGTETAAQVMTATASVINLYSFAVPNWQGLFLRGLAGTGQWDINVATRFSGLCNLSGNNVGTLELDTFQQHTHSYQFNSNTNGGGSVAADTLGAQLIGGVASVQNFTILSTGSAETQPINAAVNWFIRY